MVVLTFTFILFGLYLKIILYVMWILKNTAYFDSTPRLCSIFLPSCTYVDVVDEIY